MQFHGKELLARKAVLGELDAEFVVLLDEVHAEPSTPRPTFLMTPPSA